MKIHPQSKLFIVAHKTGINGVCGRRDNGQMDELKSLMPAPPTVDRNITEYIK